MSKNPDVIVIGAGIAGLAAAVKMSRSGLSALILEARDRIGGRIWTQRDTAGDAVELGAEFIHGFPPQIWEPLQKAQTKIVEVQGDHWCANGQLRPCDFFDQVDEILGKMDDRGPDESFLEFLQRTVPDSDDAGQNNAKRHALNYVSGFNAADPALVGAHWLTKGMRAEEVIDGQRAFRSLNGYEGLVSLFREQLPDNSVSIKTGTVVTTIDWKPGEVEIQTSGSADNSRFRARRVLLTLPLGVLQASCKGQGGIRFMPALPDRKCSALGRLEMGKVIRLVLKFRHRFWASISPMHDGKTLAKMSFLLSQDEWFPTWWSAMPMERPILTGWAPFQCAERLSGKERSFVVEKGTSALARVLKVRAEIVRSELEEAYFHDWQTDPFSLGAYSYGKVQSDGAHAALAEPLENTLFFAGEATDTTGHNGTVHGAIASGDRAAEEILKRSRRT